MDTNVIYIANDRSTGKFVAYNEDTDIFATGVCMDSATESYREKYYAKYPNQSDVKYTVSLKDTAD